MNKITQLENEITKQEASLERMREELAKEKTKLEKNVIHKAIKEHGFAAVNEKMLDLAEFLGCPVGSIEVRRNGEYSNMGIYIALNTMDVELVRETGHIATLVLTKK